MPEFLTREQLEALKFPVPENLSQVLESIASLISYAPEFVNPFFPKYNVISGYSEVFVGLDSLCQSLGNDAQRAALARCRDELFDSYEAFTLGERKKGFSLLQAARESAKDIKRKRTRHQPLPDAFE